MVVLISNGVMQSWRAPKRNPNAALFAEVFARQIGVVAATYRSKCSSARLCCSTLRMLAGSEHAYPDLEIVAAIGA